MSGAAAFDLVIRNGRVVDGTAASAEARETGAGARPLAELAWAFAQKA